MLFSMLLSTWLLLLFLLPSPLDVPIHAFWHHFPLHCCYTSVMTVARNDQYSKLVFETMINPVKTTTLTNHIFPKDRSDPKHKCTQFQTYLSSIGLHALTQSAICFVQSVSRRNQFLTGCNFCQLESGFQS